MQNPWRHFRRYTERLVRSLKGECLDRLIPVGERHLRRAPAEHVVQYHRERNYEGLANELIDAEDRQQGGRVQRLQRRGGLLSYYYEAGAAVMKKEKFNR